MSIKSSAYHSISVANNQLGGAYSSKSARTRHGREFLDYCHFNGRSLTDIKQTTFDLLKDWVTSLKAANLKSGTINNKVASIRALCEQRGANLACLGLTDTSGLGVEVRNRKGTKLPVTDEIFEAAVDGTKGGRPRDVAVIAQYARQTFEAITESLDFALKNDGFLIVSKTGSGLKGARALYHRLAAKFGLTGVYAPHSLRYRYCIDKLLELNVAGVPRNEALAFASECLGHGASRTRFVSSVYGRSVTHMLPKSTRKQNIQQVMAELSELAGY